MDNCIFCKIAAGEIPSYKIYEDDEVLAFLDIAPVNPGHVLVIPKKHFRNLEDINEEELCKLMIVIKKIGQAIKDGLGVEGYNVIENNDPVAGQIINHLHFHIIPRRTDDGLGLWPQGKYANGEAEKIMNKVKNNLAGEDNL